MRNFYKSILVIVITLFIGGSAFSQTLVKQTKALNPEISEAGIVHVVVKVNDSFGSANLRGDFGVVAHEATAFDGWNSGLGLAIFDYNAGSPNIRGWNGAADSWSTIEKFFNLGDSISLWLDMNVASGTYNVYVQLSTENEVTLLGENLVSRAVSKNYTPRDKAAYLTVFVNGRWNDDSVIDIIKEATIVETIEPYFFNEEDDGKLVTLNTSVIGTGGQIIRSPDQDNYAVGSEVALTAIPDEGYEFVGWSGDVTSTLNPLTVMMNSNKEIKASFAFSMSTQTLTPITPTDTDGVLAFQANHTNSPLGKWQMISIGHPNYFLGASNDTMLYFTGNQPNLGPADSPLEFTFIAPETATYELAIRSSRDLRGAANDHCNDFFVRMAGDFEPGHNTFSKSVLTSNTKHYFSSVPDRQWGWTILGERRIDGVNVKLRFRYALKQGEEYTLTVSGRSQRAIMDYIILFNTSRVSQNQAHNATLIMETPPEGSLMIILDETRGTVTKNPDKPVYDPGEEVVLTAIPEPGFIFDSWGLDVNSTDNPLTVTMNSTMNIQANFDVAPPADGSLIIDVNDIRGTVSRNPDKIVFDPGEIVVVTAESNPGYVFQNWSGDITSDDNPLTITMDSTIYITANFGLESIPVQNRTVLFYDNFNQEPVNPIVSSGDPVVDYTVWTTVTDLEIGGGTALIEEYAPGDGVIKLLARESISQAGNRTEVSAPLSFYNAPFAPVLSANTDTLEWIFTTKQNRNSAGGSQGFNGTNTGMAVVLAADSSVWGSQQGSNARGYAVTLLKPDGGNYCVSFSRFDKGLSNYTVIAGNREEDIFSDRRNWVTVRVTYIPTTNEWNLFFRDEESITTKGDVYNTEEMRLIETVFDDTFTDIEMTHFGFALNTPAPGGGGADPNAFFVDDFKVSKLGGDLQLFTLTTEVFEGTGGEIIIEPDQQEYASGSLVELIAIPDDGYMFVGWSGDVTSALNPLSVMMNSNKNITANFTAIDVTSYTLTITAVNGTVAQSVDGTVFAENTEVILTATPDTGYEFAGWSGDVTSIDNPLTVTMDSNKDITANFTPIVKYFTLNITSEHGVVEQSVEGTEFAENTEIVLTAVPQVEYGFVSWSGDVTSTENPLTVTINANMNITANYTVVTSIKQEPDIAFTVMPNPSYGLFSVQVMHPVSYKVYNLNGILVKEGSASETFSLDMSGYNNAIYILQVESQDGISIKRIMKISE